MPDHGNVPERGANVTRQTNRLTRETPYPVSRRRSHCHRRGRKDDPGHPCRTSRAGLGRSPRARRSAAGVHQRGESQNAALSLGARLAEAGRASKIRTIFAAARWGRPLMSIRRTPRRASDQSASSPMSSTGAEWVSAPTEITSTPVSAMARTVSRVTPPEASSLTRPGRHGDGAAQVVQGEVVEQDHVGARRAGPRELVQACRPRPRSWSGGRRAALARAQRLRPIPPQAATWLSLIRMASSRPKRWLTPPPQRTAYFSKARRPGVVLRVSTILARRCPRPPAT